MRNKHQRLVIIFFLTIIWLVVSACSSSSVPTKKPSSDAASTKSSDSSQNPTQESGGWDQISVAAGKEGKLIISAQPSEAWRRALIVPFEKKYPEIKVEFSGSGSREFWPKLAQERKVNQYLWDLRIGGADLAYKAKGDGFLTPIRPLLLPEIADDSKWLGGVDYLFADKEKKYIPAFLAYSSSQIDVNRDYIPESELSTPEQLLDPKFKGKIVLQEPRSGSGLGAMAVLLYTYGEQFVKDLLAKQDVVITSDNRQQVEWVVRGRHPIGIGLSEGNMQVFLKEGLGQNIKSLENGPVAVSSGVGAIQLFENAPHPNAARVYINWLLSKEGQTEISQIVSLNSRRLDAPPGDKQRLVNPSQISRFVDHQSEQFQPIRKRVTELAREQDTGNTKSK